MSRLCKSVVQLPLITTCKVHMLPHFRRLEAVLGLAQMVYFSGGGLGRGEGWTNIISGSLTHLGIERILPAVGPDGSIVICTQFVEEISRLIVRGGRPIEVAPMVGSR